MQTKKLSLEEVQQMIADERGKPKAGLVKFKPLNPNSRLAKLYRMQTQLLRERREAWEDKHYTVDITCPEHPNGRHTAVLYQNGHRYAGMWECPLTGASDSCEHENTHIDIAVDDHLGFNGHYQTEHEIYVCDACECTADGNPAEDRAEAIADMQIMEALGK